MSAIIVGGGADIGWTLPPIPPLTIDPGGNVSGGVNPGSPSFLPDISGCGGGLWAVADACGHVAGCVYSPPPHTITIAPQGFGNYIAAGVQGTPSWSTTGGVLLPDSHTNPVGLDTSGRNPCSTDSITLSVSDSCGAQASYTIPSPPLGDLNIAGPNPWQGSTAGYTVSNGIGTVEISASIGATGCNGGTPVFINAVDDCGRHGVLDVSIIGNLVPVWRLVETFAAPSTCQSNYVINRNFTSLTGTSYGCPVGSSCYPSVCWCPPAGDATVSYYASMAYVVESGCCSAVAYGCYVRSCGLPSVKTGLDCGNGGTLGIYILSYQKYQKVCGSYVLLGVTTGVGGYTYYEYGIP